MTGTCRAVVSGSWSYLLLVLFIPAMLRPGIYIGTDESLPLTPIAQDESCGKGSRCNHSITRAKH